MKWELRKPEPTSPIAQAVSGPIRLSVDETRDERGRTYQHIVISLGAFSEHNHEDCRKSWPREAIARVRNAIDKFGRELDEEKQ